VYVLAWLFLTVAGSGPAGVVQVTEESVLRELTKSPAVQAFACHFATGGRGGVRQVGRGNHSAGGVVISSGVAIAVVFRAVRNRIPFRTRIRQGADKPSGQPGGSVPLLQLVAIGRIAGQIASSRRRWQRSASHSRARSSRRCLESLLAPGRVCISLMFLTVAGSEAAGVAQVTEESVLRALTKSPVVQAFALYFAAADVVGFGRSVEATTVPGA